MKIIQLYKSVACGYLRQKGYKNYVTKKAALDFVKYLLHKIIGIYLIFTKRGAHY